MAVTVEDSPVRAPPALDSAVLDEDTGVLTLSFNDAMDVGSVMLDGMSVHEAGAADRTALTGATLITASNGTTLAINLTASQLRSAAALDSPQIHIAAGAVSDTSGNGIEASTSNLTRVGSTPPNSPPVADAGDDQVVSEGATVQLDGSATTDPDGNAILYSWTAPPDVILSNATAAAPTFTAPLVSADTTYTFTLTVTDGAGYTDADTVTITVRDTDSTNMQAPAPAAPSNLAAASATADSVTLTWGAPADPSITGYAILYRISAVQPDLGVLVNDTGSTNSTYVVHGLEPGTTYEFGVAALNGTGASAVSNLVTVSTKALPATPPDAAPRICR